MDNQVKMALKILNLRSPHISPVKLNTESRRDSSQKYKTGSQGIIRRNSSKPRKSPNNPIKKINNT